MSASAVPLPKGVQKVGRMSCPTCAFSWKRTSSNADKRSCPKCNSDLGLDAANPAKKKPSRMSVGGVSGVGARRQPGEASTFKHAPGKAIVVEEGSCPKNDGGKGPHMFKFGACSHCRKQEGKLLKGRGSAVNPGGKGSCAKGGKCTFMFSKCKKCGVSELK